MIKIVRNTTKRNQNTLIFEDGVTLVGGDKAFTQSVTDPAGCFKPKPEPLHPLVSLALAYSTPREQR